jgi:hypothetical protein
MRATKSSVSRRVVAVRGTGRRRGRGQGISATDAVLGHKEPESQSSVLSARVVAEARGLLKTSCQPSISCSASAHHHLAVLLSGWLLRAEPLEGLGSAYCLRAVGARRQSCLISRCVCSLRALLVSREHTAAEFGTPECTSAQVELRDKGE